MSNVPHAASVGGTRRLLLALVLWALGGCVSDHASRETHVQRLLAKGDYPAAIAEIERGPQSAEWQFSLGILYAYREMATNGEQADFTAALRLIRSAAADNEQARQFLADYQERGVQVFIAFPWAHLIGPFHSKPHRPEPSD